jgi:branched-subunit amino acid aminotransferase/4-amino-4-deoxychorismate lyase
LIGADEAFLTSSLRGIAPLVEVDDVAIGGGVPGALTRRIADAYAALVAEQCGPASIRA